MNKIFLVLTGLLLISFVSFSQTYLISDGGEVFTCSGTLYDSGGASGNYSDDEEYTITICGDSGTPIQLEFTTFSTENSYDELTIHDGPNDAAPVLIEASGSTLQGEIITSSSNCLTLVFDSDGSVSSYAGFAAEISCLAACQDFNVEFGTLNPPMTNPDSLMLDLCQGTSVDFSVYGDYYNNNGEYIQSDATTHFLWEVYDGINNEVFEGDGMTELSYTFDNEGGYYITVTATDLNGCTNQNLAQMRVRVSLRPSFDGVSILQDTVCINDEVNLDGYGHITPFEWSLPIPTIMADTAFLPDGNDVEYTSEITYQMFAPGQTLDNPGDILGICANMEHSYTGDLTVWLECPDGSTMSLFDAYSGSAGGEFMGEPVDNDSDLTPGVGYDYCWVQGASTTINDAADEDHTYTFTDASGTEYTDHTYIPSGDYAPEGSWSDLVGCPLNGTWTIHVFDNMSIDNGFIFNWQLFINPDIIPDDLWVFENEYDTTYSSVNTNVYWTGDNVISDVAGDAIAIPTAAGTATYVLHAIDDFGCSYDTTLTVHVLPEEDPACCVIPAANAGPDAQVCSDTYTLNTSLNNPINTVTWAQVSGPGVTNFNGQQNSTNPTIQVDTYGVYRYELYEENTGPACCDRDTVEITFFSTPTTTFTASFVNCYGDASEIVYTGTGTAAATYTWDFDGGANVGTGQGPINVTWADAGIHPVTLSVEENGCSTQVTVVNVLTPEMLTHVLTTEDDPCNGTCEGNAEIFVQGGTLPYTYSWGNSSVNANICAGNYGITVTDNNGCEVSENYVINEPPPIVINNVTTQDIDCFNADNGSIIINAGGGFGMLTYSWSDGGTGSNRQNLPAGIYSLTIEDENGCSITDQYELTQPTELLISISPDQAHCEGAISTVSAQAMGGTQPYTYFWDSGNGFFPNQSEITVSPEQTTNYIVYVEDDHGCTTSPVSMTMTISPQMYMTLTTQDNRCYHSCDGEALLQIQGGIPPLNYSWSADGAMNTDLCAGMYDVTVTDILGCNVDTTFYISEPPQMFANAYTEDATCFGYDDGLAWVEAVGGVPGYTYLWPDGTSNDSIVLGAGRYIMTISDDHDCRLEVEAVIDEPDAIHAELVGGDRWICKSNSTLLNSQAIGGTPYYDFNWTGTDGSSYVIHNPEVSPDTTTEYTLTVVDSHGCSSNMPRVTVNVYPDLEIESLITSYDSICPGDPAIIELEADGGNGGPYTLTLHTGEVVPSPFTVYPQETTNYIITLSDACGSPVVHDSIEIVVMPSPDNAFVSDKVEGCPPFNVHFNEMSEDVGQTYLWNFGDDGFAYEKNPGHIYQQGGQYDVSLTVTSPFGCENTRTIANMIHVFEKPLADFHTDNNFVSVLDPEVQFFNVSELADSSYWFFGDGDSSHFVSPSHNFDNVGEYEVKLIVESREGCYDTITKFINVRDEFTFWAPTAFSPNGDGDNDFFMVYGNGIDPNEFLLRIYDRWGEQVYESTLYDPDRPIESAWDGTYDGNRSKGDRLLHTGSYSWYCKFKDFTGVWHEYEGVVTLLR